MQRIACAAESNLLVATIERVVFNAHEK